MVFRVFLCAAVCFSLIACSPFQYNKLIASADSVAFEAGFSRAYIEGSPFQLLTYSKINPRETTATLYIEGDGRAWITRNRVSLNPTPRNSLMLELATLDTVSKNIVYLGRPCQYRPTHQDAECAPKYWTMERYSLVVVDAMSRAIDALKEKYGFKDLALVGHSGGGTLAVLIAAQRSDVVSIKTVAANLDIEAFVDWHKVSPMTGSLNPVDYVESVKHIPQQHYFGQQDEAVPMSTIKRYRSALLGVDCIAFSAFDNVEHRKGWVSLWPDLLSQKIAPCR